MRKLKRLTGAQLLAILRDFGFLPVSQRGSHVKLYRMLPDGSRQILIVPNHRELDRGTVHAIYRQCSRYIPEPDLKAKFYTE
jgi:predicted RNA binding protein YcfA (HicA-like mRNA interferase family)